MAPNTKVILLVGRTGGGKSTLGNLILDADCFAVGHFGTSATRRFQKETREIDGTLYTVVDTTGLGDTNIDKKNPLFHLAEACEAVKDQLHQILFVVNGRFTEAEVEAYELLASVFYGKDITKFTTIVRTRFPFFRDLEKCREDFEAMKRENPTLQRILTGCNKVLYLNNLSAAEDPGLSAQKDSRLRIMMHLQGCREVYRPDNSISFHKKVEAFKTPQEVLREQEAAKARAEEERKRLEKQLWNTKLVNAYRILLNCLNSIYPGACNRGEWSAIRSTASSELGRVNAENIAASFTNLLQLLSGIYPGKCNCGEWSSIRSRCASLKGSMTTPENVYQGLQTLCRCFQSIYPGKCNRSEWATIRSTSADVCNQLR